jgi:hypothetical protein
MTTAVARTPKMLKIQGWQRIVGVVILALIFIRLVVFVVERMTAPSNAEDYNTCAAVAIASTSTNWELAPSCQQLNYDQIYEIAKYVNTVKN